MDILTKFGKEKIGINQIDFNCRPLAKNFWRSSSEGRGKKKSSNVDLARIELASLQCECSVVPLDHKPNFIQSIK